MTRFLIRRLLTTIPLLLAILLFSFLFMRSAPGGPFDDERQLPPQIEANLQAKYHLDEPVGKQFLRYMGGLLHGRSGAVVQVPGPDGQRDHRPGAAGEPHAGGDGAVDRAGRRDSRRGDRRPLSQSLPRLRAS